MVSETTWPRALLCCVREVMFFKRSQNISELILIYFKYFYGMGYFLLTLSREALGPIGPSIFKGLQLKA